jgi:hypothetical protein
MSTDSDGKTYVIRQGDTLLRLTVRFGLAGVEEIRDHPKNKKLKDDLDAGLCPIGEILFIPKPQPPTLQASPQTENKYAVKVPLHVVQIAFSGREGPFANEAYELRGIGEDPTTGNLDGTGTLRVEVPAAIEKLTLVFPKRHIEHTIWVGHLAPLGQLPGVDARLAHLGYGPVGEKHGEPHTFMDAAARARTISVFQAAFGLDQTGFADETTRDKMKEKHNC